VAFASFDIDFVPPSQTNQASSSDVLKVVEIDGEEDERKDENKDAERGGQLHSRHGW
jgi:very-short-patch-repair endonuclease